MRLRALSLLVGGAALLAGARYAVVGASRFSPPSVAPPALRLESVASGKRAGRSFTRNVRSILEVHLTGGPEEIGEAHALLLHDRMVETEAAVWELFREHVPSALFRRLLLDAGAFPYRHLPDGLLPERRHELAASALAFRPDPFEDRFPTFQRFVYLSALYDISLAYEHSPLVGCTTFTFSNSGTSSSPILARNFDFDAHPVFDEHKAVFVVREDGKIPFASVAWAGLVGVVSGMNAEGLAVVVHGARAGPLRTEGEPLVFELRRLLSDCRTTEEAIRALALRSPLVSHVVVMTDGAGHAAAVEQIPGSAPFVRRLGSSDVVTNHLYGPGREDAKNRAVLETSSTLARELRGRELSARAPNPVTATDAVRLLRDRAGPRGEPLPVGDRRAIDALIATHGVIFETATGRLWVSEAPHVSGAFVAFDLPKLLTQTNPADDAPRDLLRPAR